MLKWKAPTINTKWSKYTAQMKNRINTWYVHCVYTNTIKWLPSFWEILIIWEYILYTSYCILAGTQCTYKELYWSRSFVTTLFVRQIPIPGPASLGESSWMVQRFLLDKKNPMNLSECKKDSHWLRILVKLSSDILLVE